MKLSEKAVEDLSTLAMERCRTVMIDVLQLIDDPQQKMIASTNVAALMFGLAARFLQYDYKAKNGCMPPFEKAVDAVTFHVAKLAIENPPEDSLVLKKDEQSGPVSSLQSQPSKE